MALTKVTADLIDLEKIEPVGTIHMYAGSTEPEGYLFCNGQEISRSEYSDLFGIISTTYGNGDNSTTFNVPDFRAMFPRGAKMGATGTVEVNSINYTPQNLGIKQSDAMQGHRHRISSEQNYNTNTGPFNTQPRQPAGNQTYDNVILDPISDGTNGTPRTAAETRPLNLSINFIIKY